MSNSRPKKICTLANAVAVCNEEDGQHTKHLYLPLLLDCKDERHDCIG